MGDKHPMLPITGWQRVKSKFHKCRVAKVIGPEVGARDSLQCLDQVRGGQALFESFEIYALWWCRVSRPACETRGGRLLEFRQGGSDGTSVATVECAEGHIWQVSYASLVTAGSWCQKCHLTSMVAKRSYHKKLTIEHFRKLARDRGGRCLSSSYSGAECLLDYECSNGHAFSQLAGVTSLGHWCPTCAISNRAEKKRASIQEIRAEANRRGGSCLSVSYDAPRAPL